MQSIYVLELSQFYLNLSLNNQLRVISLSPNFPMHD